MLPLVLEDRRSFKVRTEALGLVSAVVRSNLVRADIKPIAPEDLTSMFRSVDAIGQSPSTKRGLTQTLISFTIITVLGVSLFGLLISGSSDAGDLRKTTITALLAILGTIVGFYFGARAAGGGEEGGGFGEPQRTVTIAPPPEPLPMPAEAEAPLAVAEEAPWEPPQEPELEPEPGHSADETLDNGGQARSP
jgi:hypothetical protein